MAQSLCTVSCMVMYHSAQHSSTMVPDLELVKSSWCFVGWACWVFLKGKQITKLQGKKCPFSGLKCTVSDVKFVEQWWRDDKKRDRDFKACQETGVARERPVQRNGHGKAMSSARAYEQRCQEKGMARKEMWRLWRCTEIGDQRKQGCQGGM